MRAVSIACGSCSAYGLCHSDLHTRFLGDALMVREGKSIILPVDLQETLWSSEKAGVEPEITLVVVSVSPDRDGLK